jgi:hypothetical protein
MKNDTTTTFLNFVLAALVILGVLFALLGIWKGHDARRIQARVQVEAMNFQTAMARANVLLNDTITYNATAKSPELTAIIQSVQNSAPAVK